ncbi:MAG: hypothetical protein R3C11_22510 [Planctomycetaceae bacterium]
MLHKTDADDYSNPKQSSITPAPSKLFSLQYRLFDPSFCNAGACADFNGDGKRELCFTSRWNYQFKMLNAADGEVLWSKQLDGRQQSMAAFDLNQDGQLEILYTVSSPGLVYLLSGQGEILQQWDAGDHKIGNSAVVIDVDGDNNLEGFFGTRARSFVRLSMPELNLVSRREAWGQCGCHTSALDVDGDGEWDLFAGSGDDHDAKGVMHRINPRTLESVWSFKTDDNASSADPVLADINGDGTVEIIKSVDNYNHDDSHEAIYAFDIDGNILWKAPGYAGEDSPNVADLDGDGELEIVGMTFGGEVYCLNTDGTERWKKDLRPELDNASHAYLTPLLCDVDGDRELEILAITNHSFPSDGNEESSSEHGIVVALSATGEEFDRFDVGGPRYWGEAFLVNVDEDPWQELVISGQGGLDVIQTRGYGPQEDYVQRRRTYQRLNVYPWAYEDTYFIHQGTKTNLTSRADALVLKQDGSDYVSSGSYQTELLRLPDTDFYFE